MTERRNEGRFLCADLVRVDWMAPNVPPNKSDVNTEQALLEDISHVGGCIQLEHSVPLGSTMMLTLHEATFVGSVCYCSYRDYGYFVGMRFSSDSPWDRETVVPDHLTNLQELACRARLQNV